MSGARTESDNFNLQQPSMKWPLLATACGVRAKHWIMEIKDETFLEPAANGDQLFEWKRISDLPLSSIIALAECYQSSAILYFIRSVQSAHLKSSSPFEYQSFEWNTNQLLEDHMKRLSDRLGRLCDGVPSPCDSGKNSQLWKFVSWPLFVHAYELVGWSAPRAKLEEPALAESPSSPASNVSVNATFARMLRVGKLLGSKGLLDGIKLLHRVCSKRAQGADWKWDDGFTERCVLIV